MLVSPSLDILQLCISKFVVLTTPPSFSVLIEGHVRLVVDLSDPLKIFEIKCVN